MVCKEARDSLGSYQDGWPALQPETIARKMMGDSPLLASIQWNSEGNEGYVGSDDMKAVYHELGTSRIPARPFLGPAAAENGRQDSQDGRQGSHGGFDGSRPRLIGNARTAPPCGVTALLILTAFVATSRAATIPAATASASRSSGLASPLLKSGFEFTLIPVSGVAMATVKLCRRASERTGKHVLI